MTHEETYAAVISLSLPGMAGVTSAHITLTAPDMVKSGALAKPLRECTLADIQAFAEVIEQDVWELVQTIRLVDLDEQEEANVEVSVEGQKGQRIELPNWGQQIVLLSAQVEPEVAPAGDDPLPVESLSSEAKSGDDSEDDEGASDVRGEVPPSLPSDHAGDDSLHEDAPAGELALVTVSESEPVFAEREAEDDPNAFPTPHIAPSQARVRIAGRRLPPGHQTWAAVDILIDEPAMRAAQAHALSSPDREVAGVLLGPPPEKQPDGRYIVHVIDTIIAKYTVMHGASVTYTPESWRYMSDKLAERYPDETAVIVGWYHTHPGFGIFLSGMDQFIHQNFFTQIWHTALVLDPISQSSGFFCWNHDKSSVKKYDFYWPNWAVASW
jgi:proteasome lid subunit RPN8/RPN11